MGGRERGREGRRTYLVGEGGDGPKLVLLFLMPCEGGREGGREVGKRRR